MIVYDGHGIRIRKCSPNCGSPTSSTIYIFSGSKVIAEYDNGAAVASPSREYIYSGAQLLAKSESDTLTYYHSDHLSNRATTDSSGNVLGQRAHYPFGETWYESGAASKLKFTTYERDSETGNDFAMARYAVSGLGRFSSPDALAGSALAPQSMNRFSYVQNDPINSADPSGLVRTPWGFAFSDVGFGSSWNEFDLLFFQVGTANIYHSGSPYFRFEDFSSEQLAEFANEGEIQLLSSTPIYQGILLDASVGGGGLSDLLKASIARVQADLKKANCAKDFNDASDVIDKAGHVDFSNQGAPKLRTKDGQVTGEASLGKYNGFTGSINLNTAINWADPANTSATLDGKQYNFNVLAAEASFLAVPSVSAEQLMDITILHELSHYDGAIGNPDKQKLEKSLWNDCIN